MKTLVVKQSTSFREAVILFFKAEVFARDAMLFLGLIIAVGGFLSPQYMLDQIDDL